MVLNALDLSSYGPEWGKPLSLFTNAIQAMDGKGTLSLSTKSRNGMVAVPIGETGSGNSKEFMGRIFTPFSPMAWRSSELVMFFRKVRKADWGRKGIAYGCTDQSIPYSLEVACYLETQPFEKGPFFVHFCKHP